MFRWLKNKILDKKILDQATLDQIEEDLILADIGVDLTFNIVETLKKNNFNKECDIVGVKKIIKEEIIENLKNINKQLDLKGNKNIPNVLIISGANGSGKTTTIGKISYLLNALKKKSMLIPSDTFRAAAKEQLNLWGKKLNVSVFESETVDPASVAYQGVLMAKNEKFDVVMVDTSGRLSNNTNLMLELAKIENTVKKVIDEKNHTLEHIIVLDGTVSQASIYQLEGFLKYVKVTGIIITKLDGISKGGIVLYLMQKFKIPVYFIGIGEKQEDLQVFNLENYLDNILFKDNF
jgi:fused signal recognition particle receptor